jgi:hypothetical protein
MHLIKRGFVKGYKTWSHHGEAKSTFNNADIGTRYDEVGDEDADENDHVMMLLAAKIKMMIKQTHHRWTRSVMLIWKKCCATLNRRCC